MFDKKKTPGHRLGAAGEKAAAGYLRKKGYRIIKKNYMTSFGEIDIICTDKKHVVFVEVKSRTDSDWLKVYGRPANAVNRDKKRKIVRGVHEYMKKVKNGKIPRIDIIEVYFSPGNIKDYKIVHLEHAVGEQF